MKGLVPAALVLLALGGFFFGFSGSVDDAHITFYAAQVLGEQGVIVNYNGERVEQSSALLQVLLLGGLHALTGSNVVVLGHVTTLLSALAVLPLTARLAQRLCPGSAGSALALLATAPFFVYWSCGGMESPLLALCLLLVVSWADTCLRTGRAWPVLVLASLGAQMARPEMPWLLMAWAAALLPLQWYCRLPAWRWRPLWGLLLLQCLLAALLATWRWQYFGAWVPQPVSAKVGGSLLAALSQGLQYLQLTLLDWRLGLSTLLIVAGAGRIVWCRREPLPLLLVLLAGVYGGFVVLSGGDWMAAGRFWVPVLPLLLLLAALALQALPLRPPLRQLVVAAAVSGQLLCLWHGTTVDSNGVPLWKTTVLTEADRAGDFSFFERHAREHLHDIPTLAFVRPLVGNLLAARGAQANAAPLTIMAGQMGMVPFYLAGEFGHRLHFQDRNGITERTLTHCPAAQGLLRTRNGIGTGYAWLFDNQAPLARECGFVLPDIVFDIETGWNRHNIQALAQAGYVFVYRQRGHVFAEAPGEWLPARRIGAGQFIALSADAWRLLGQPAPVERRF